MKASWMILLLPLFLVCSCFRDNDDLAIEPIDTVRPTLVISGEEPVCGSVVDSETNVKLKITYSIPPGIREGYGFRLVIWTKMDNSRFPYGNSWYNLKDRSGTLEIERPLNKWSYYPLPQDSVVFHVSLIRVESGMDSPDLALSNAIKYYIRECE